ncbi:MAG: hypothetical protein J6B29_00460 [Clostridia bacterium]|nr:hypothetical protein [Clostridia bacterium]
MLRKNWKSIVAFLCILLIIAYTFIVFLPHAHDCVGSDCTVCALIETSRNTIIGLALVATAHQLANAVFTISSSYKFMPLRNDGTPVALKVKLSD